MASALIEAYERRLSVVTEEFYAPGQLRDREGQWTRGGAVRTGGGFGGMSAHPDTRVKPKVKMTADEFAAREVYRHWYEGDLPNGHKSVIKKMVLVKNPNKSGSNGYGEVAITGVIINKHGDHAGEFERTLRYSESTQELSVRHDSFDMDLPGSGVGTAFNQRAVAGYRAMGVDRVETYAAQEVGAYAWAREGFRAGAHDYGYGVQEADTRASRMSGLVKEANRRIDMWEQFGQHPLHVVEQTRKQLDALERASDAGEDVQPIHIASIGEDSYRFKERTLKGDEYDTWPGKEMMLGQAFPGVYYFDANGTVTAAAEHLEEFAFDPRQARDRDGKWTVSVQHVASQTSADAISREGFRTSGVQTWAQNFGPGVYFSESGDRKSAKRYSQQGHGRTTTTSQVISAELSLRNPLHVDIRTHADFRQQATVALGGKERLSELAQTKYEKNVEIARRILTDELKTDNPEAFKKLDMDRPEDAMFWDFDEAVADRAFNRIETETGGVSLFDFGDWRALASATDEVLKPVSTSSDTHVRHSQNISILLRDAGYDGIVINTTSGGGVGDTQVVAFDPSSITVTGVEPYDRRRRKRTVTASVEEFYSPTQPRDKEGQWATGGAVGAAYERHRAGITSLSRDTLDNVLAKGLDGLFPHGSDTGQAPWPRAPRLKTAPLYDKALVAEALNKPPVLEKVDPRIMYSTQPGLVRSHVDYYTGDDYSRSGRPSADQGNPGNQFPVVYVNAKGQHFILAGHHRAAASLLKGEELDAIVVRETRP